MILTVKYQAWVLCLLHDDQGHQGLQQTLVLCQEILLEYHVQDVTNYMKNVNIAKQQRKIM